MPSVTTTAGGCAIVIIMGSANRHRPTRTELCYFFVYRRRTHRERIPGTMRVDVSYVFTPFLAVPCLLMFHPDEQGTSRAAQMFDHGQFGSSEQETVGHLHVPHEMGPQDPDPAAPGTHRITGNDLLWPHQGDAAFTDGREDPPCLRFLEDLIN